MELTDKESLQDRDSDEDEYSRSESDDNDKKDNDSINSGGEDAILAFIDDEEEVGEASNDTLWKIHKPNIGN